MELASIQKEMVSRRVAGLTSQHDFLIFDRLLERGFSYEELSLILEGPKIPSTLDDIPGLIPIRMINRNYTESKKIICREDIGSFIEYPVRKACQDLYDKNIETQFSSANYTDIGNNACILASMSIHNAALLHSLFPQNVFSRIPMDIEHVLEKTSEKLQRNPNDTVQYKNIDIGLRVKLDIDTTVEEVVNSFDEIIHCAQTQPLRWGYMSSSHAPYSPEEIYRILARNTGFVYDFMSGNVFFSFEMCNKYYSSISKDQRERCEMMYDALTAQGWFDECLEITKYCLEKEIEKQCQILDN